MKRSRRKFLQSAGLAASAGPVLGQAETRSVLAPSGKPERLSENLFRFEDTCNVYVVRDGSRCVLIDFGSGKILDHLPSLGISHVDWILHTHHHRDQCQGDYKAIARNIPVAVPRHERHLFADAENFWRNRRVFHLYYVRNDFNTVTKNIRVSGTLDDYEVFRWRAAQFFVLPTPGHTLGSVSLLARIDGRELAFTGDLMYAPGKILNLYDTQINYGGAEGIDLAIFSLARLRERKPEMLLPSHGDVMAEPASAIDQTIRRLSDYYRFQTGNAPSDEGVPQAVSRQLVCHHTTMSSFYAIISASGKAMFIDYGSPSPVHFGNFERATAVTDRVRFQEHSLDRLRRDFGMKSVEVAMPTHTHDDHVNGFPHLIRHHNVKIWCYENMVDILQNPRGYNLGCLLAEPFRVSRSFRDGERFRWEEFDFEIKHSPGHTEHQMALFATIDGKRIAFTGDAFFANPRNDGTLRHNIIYRNHVENDSHLKSIRNVIDREPELICPGHGQPYPVDRKMLFATEQKFRTQQQYFVDLLPRDVDFGLDPSWVSLYPYQILAAPGGSREITIKVRNYRPSTMKAEVALVVPPEWTVVPEVVHLEIAPNGTGSAKVSVSIPRQWAAPGPRFAIAADVRCDGKYLGQVTEAVVEMAPPARGVRHSG